MANRAFDKEVVNVENGNNTKARWEAAFGYYQQQEEEQGSNGDAQRTEGQVVFNICCDISGSMLGAKITALKLGLAAFVANMKDDDLLNLNTFNDRLDNVSGGFKRIDEIKPLLSDILTNNFHPDGCTACYDTVLAGIGQLRHLPIPHDHQNQKRALIVLTDGEDTASLSTASKVFRRLGKPGVDNFMFIVVSIQMSPDNEANMAQWMTFRHCKQISVQVKTGARLVSIFREVLMSRIFATDASCNRFYRIPPPSSPSTSSLQQPVAAAADVSGNSLEPNTTSSSSSASDNSIGNIGNVTNVQNNRGNTVHYEGDDDADEDVDAELRNLTQGIRNSSSHQSFTSGSGNLRRNPSDPDFNLLHSSSSITNIVNSWASSPLRRFNRIGQSNNTNNVTSGSSHSGGSDDESESVDDFNHNDADFVALTRDGASSPAMMRCSSTSASPSEGMFSSSRLGLRLGSFGNINTSNIGNTGNTGNNLISPQAQGNNTPQAQGNSNANIIPASPPLTPFDNSNNNGSGNNYGQFRRIVSFVDDDGDMALISPQAISQQNQQNQNQQLLYYQGSGRFPLSLSSTSSSSRHPIRSNHGGRGTSPSLITPPSPPSTVDIDGVNVTDNSSSILSLQNIFSRIMANGPNTNTNRGTGNNNDNNRPNNNVITTNAVSNTSNNVSDNQTNQVQIDKKEGEGEGEGEGKNTSSANASGKFKGQCVLCLEENSANYALIPCGHVCYCSNCFNNQKLPAVPKQICPICRRPFTQVLQIFNA